MSVLKLVRHAPTVANIADVYMGGQDVPASPEGLHTAMATILDDHGCDVVYSSPLNRASATAKALFPKARVELDERLKERCLGLWEGMPKGDVRSQYPDAYTADGHLNPRYTPPHGESLEQFTARIKDFMVDMQDLGSIVVVTHNGWIRTALWLLGYYKVNQIFAEHVPYLTPVEVSISRSSVAQ